MSVNLWNEIVLENDDSQIIEKIEKKKSTSSRKKVSSKLTFSDRLIQIDAKVKRILGKRIEETVVIDKFEDLQNYISAAIMNGIITVDTETNNSLDPLTCKLMGLCLYTAGQRQVYVPINHTNLNNERLSWQLTEEDCRSQLQRLLDNNVKILYHNAKFDYQVIKETCNIKLSIYWDTLLGAKILNENESAGLKEQYHIHIDPEQEKYSIEELFEGEKYAYFPPSLFALYAATDAIMTYELYLYQVQEFKNYEKLYNVFMNIEMPCIVVIAEMELTGIEIDKDYAERLSIKYHKELDKIEDKLKIELSKYDEKINQWLTTSEATIKPKIYLASKSSKALKDENGYYKLGKSKAEQLSIPINLDSPIQLSILLYDIIKVDVVDKSSPRGTGKEILKQIDLDLCKLIIERKSILKLVKDFVDSLPNNVNYDGRIHCHFNQYGADTGRFSSSDPNLQQVPSKAKDIRMMFKASDNYVLCGSDFSQQEPRLFSFMSHDKNMIEAYQNGKDLYATIAMGVYHNGYWDNMEHYEDGSPNVEGAVRRSKCKGLLLGILYGRGVDSIAEAIEGTKEEAQEIIDNFYKAFPDAKKWINQTMEEGKKTGYVEDLFGRRRRLPDLTLPEYEVKVDTSKSETFNPFLNCVNRVDVSIDKKIKEYEKKMQGVKWSSQYNEIKTQAKQDGIIVLSNSNKIADAERQSVNARIQGSAASMTKIAMVKLYNDKRLTELGFRLLLQVHDELIGECPEQYADEVAERLTSIMKTCISDVCTVPFKCDASICSHWYEDEFGNKLQKVFNELKSKMSEKEAFDKLKEEHIELTEEQLVKMLGL